MRNLARNPRLVTHFVTMKMPIIADIERTKLKKIKIVFSDFHQPVKQFKCRYRTERTRTVAQSLSINVHMP